MNLQCRFEPNRSCARWSTSLNWSVPFKPECQLRTWNHIRDKYADLGRRAGVGSTAAMRYLALVLLSPSKTTLLYCLSAMYFRCSEGVLAEGRWNLNSGATQSSEHALVSRSQIFVPGRMGPRISMWDICFMRGPSTVRLRNHSCEQTCPSVRIGDMILIHTCSCSKRPNSVAVDTVAKVSINLSPVVRAAGFLRLCLHVHTVDRYTG